MTDNNLNTNFLDNRVATYKTVVGLVPGFGSILSEIVGAIIPDQRMDRLVKYIKILDEKIRSIDEDLLKLAKSNEQIVDLIEEGFVQASRALTDERREYIANVVINGLTDKEKRYSDSKYILKLLSEFNDQEIIWLCSYMYIGTERYREFIKNHHETLKPISRSTDVSQKEIEEAAIQDAYKNHLERLNLIVSNYKVDKSSNQLILDTNGKPKLLNIRLTSFGKLLLKQIGLFNN